MKKGAVLVLMLFAQMILFACQCGQSAFAEAKIEPNIVFILTDDQRLEDVNYMPRLKKLIGDEGASFSNYFSSVSLCCPSRTSILRGQYAHNTGVMTNGGNNGGYGVVQANNLENSTVATWLHDRGYTTALIGKYLNYYPGAKGDSFVPPGWDYWASAVGGRPYSEYNYTLNENGKSVRYGEQPSDYGTDNYTDKAIQFIKENCKKRKPFFVYLAFYAPHSPAIPATRHADMFSNAKIERTRAFNEADVSKKPAFVQQQPLMTDREILSADAFYRKRLCSLQAVDESIERVYNELKANHQLDNTYIFFASDNGYHIGEHRLRRGKQTAYETDIHLPLMVRGPGIAHGVKIEPLAGNVDLAPTWADIAGAKAPDFVDGRSLNGLLHGEQTRDWRKAFLVEHWVQGRAAQMEQQMPSNSDAEEDKTSMKHDCAMPSCAMQCAHMAKCGCGSDGYSDTTNGASSCQSNFETTSADRLIEEPDNQPVYASYNPDLQIAQTLPVLKNGTPSDIDETGPVGRRSRRRKRQAGNNSRRVKIPELRALRTPTGTYVEYVSGELEYYLLADDPDQINNRAGDKNFAMKPFSNQLQKMKKAGGKEARKIEAM